MLEWVFRRCDGDGRGGRDADRPRADRGRRWTPTGWPIDAADLERAADASTPAEWLAEIEPIREFYAEFGEKLPAELRAQLDALEQRLTDAATR